MSGLGESAFSQTTISIRFDFIRTNLSRSKEGIVAIIRHALIALFLGMVSTNAVSAQAWADKMFKDGLVHDFGVVPKGAQLFHRFTITNIYSVKMEIVNIRSGCGCTSATSSVKVLEPRESATIDVTMDARRFSGSKTVIVYVTVGPEYVSTAEIRVTGNSRSDVVFNPGQVAFGVVSQGQKAEQTIEVEYAGTQNWQITEVISKDTPLEATFKESYRKPGQIGYQVSVTLKPDAPSGNLKEFIHLKTNDTGTPLLSVLVEATIQSSISVSPALLSLGTIKPEESLTRRVVVRASKPFKVLGVDGLGEGIELGTQPTSEASMVQTVTFKCSIKQEGQFKKQLKIKTDLQETPILVTIEGTTAP